MLKTEKLFLQLSGKNVAEVLQKGVTTYPDIAVCNFMKAKHGYYKSYEDYEKLNTKSISSSSPLRKGWSLAKRIDNPGTDVSWTHFTVDWFDSIKIFKDKLWTFSRLGCVFSREKIYESS